MGLGYLHLYGVQARFPDQNFSVKIQEIRIGYGLRQFLLVGLVPEAFSDDALIIHPRLYFRLDEAGATVRTTDDPPAVRSQDFFAMTESLLQQMDFLKRLTLRDGEVYLVKGDSVEFRLATDLAGLLFTTLQDSLHIKVSGKTLSSDQDNLTITANANLHDGTIGQLKARLHGYDLSQSAFMFPNAIQFTQGFISGQIDLSQKEDSIGFDLSGSLRLSSGRAELLNQPIVLSDIQVEARLEQLDLVVQRAHLIANTSRFDISGKIFNVLAPQFDLHAVSDSVKLDDLGEWIKSDHEPLRGHGRLYAMMMGTVQDPELAIELFFPSVSLARESIKNLRVSGHFANNTLNIRQCDAELRQSHLGMQGSIDLNSGNQLSGVFLVRGDMKSWLPKWLSSRLQKCPILLTGQLAGTLSQPILLGNAETVAHAIIGDSLRAAVSFSSDHQMLRVRHLDRKVGLRLDGFWRFASGEFHFDIERFLDLAAMLWNLPARDLISKNIHSTLSVQGSLDQVVLNCDLFQFEGGQKGQALLKLESQVDYKDSIYHALGQFSWHPGNAIEQTGKWNLTVAPDRFDIQELTLGDRIEGHYSIDRSVSSAPIRGMLAIRNLDLASFLPQPDSSIQGSLTLLVDASGTLDSPDVTVSMNWNGAQFQSIGPYNCSANLHLQDQRLSLQNLTLGTERTTLLFTEGALDLATRELDFQIKGAGFDLSTVVNTAWPEKSDFSGEALVNIAVAGTIEHPDVRGLVALKNAKLLTVPFDEVEVHLGDDSTDHIAKASPRLFLNKIRFTRSEQYEVSGRGYFPLGSADSLKIDLQGQGNFLAIFPDISHFFRRSRSDGTVTGRIRGTTTRPVLEDATFLFSNGSMEFEKVVPLVTECSGLVSYKPAEQFIHVEYLEGLMGGKRFRMSNTLASPDLSSKALQNMVLTRSGFNLGVIVLETPDQFVPLNIVGLMEPGVYGKLELLGRTDDEKFYLAGLEDGQTVRGTVRLYNSEVMFPFYEGVGEPAPLVTDFLFNLEWDIRAIAMKDVRFVRSFPGAIDNVYVNLQVDDQFGGLDFLGRVIDESFRIDGRVRSTNGIVEYLDMNFRVDQAGADWDRSTLIPVVYGTARTTTTDSMGISSQIFLTMQTVDETLDNRTVDDNVRQEQGRGRWDQIRFKLSSDNPNMGSTEAQILASLGYSTATLSSKAFDAIGFSTENIILRPLIRPMERKIEQLFGLDYVRFSSRFTKNLIQFNLDNNPQLNSRLALLRSTRLILGKYLLDRIFLQYTGQVEAGIDYRYQDKNIGLHHTFGLEYRVNPQLLLELMYDYDSLMRYNQEDARIVLRHWFLF